MILKSVLICFVVAVALTIAFHFGDKGTYCQGGGLYQRHNDGSVTMVIAADGGPTMCKGGIPASNRFAHEFSQERR